MVSTGIDGQKTRETTTLAPFDDSEVIVIEGTVGEGETRTFEFTDPSGMKSDGFVVRYHGELYAYKNVCRHQPLPLDYGDGEFMTDDHEYLLCRNHGALFEPDTGLCVSGPCTGACLFQYPVEERENQMVVTIPKQEIELE